MVVLQGHPGCAGAMGTRWLCWGHGTRWLCWGHGDVLAVPGTWNTLAVLVPRGHVGCAGAVPAVRPALLRGRSDCLANLPTLLQPRFITSLEVLTAPHGAVQVHS